MWSPKNAVAGLSANPAAASWSRRKSDISGSGSSVRGTSAGHRLNHGRCGVMSRIIPVPGATLNLGSSARLVGCLVGAEEGPPAGLRRDTGDGGARLFLRGLRLIVSYIKTHPAPFLIAVGGSMVYALASIGLTVALGRATDNVLRPAFNGGVPASEVWLAIAAIMAAGTLRALGIMVRRYYSGVAGARVMATLRTRIADRYRDLSLQFHKETPTGELMAHMEADVKAAVDVLHPIPFATGVLFLVLFAMISLFVTDLYLAVIGILLFPTLALMNRASRDGWRARAARAGADRRGLLRRAREHRRRDDREDAGARGRRDRAAGRQGARAAARARRGRVHPRGFEPALEALPAIGMIVLLAVGSWRVSTGDVTLGDLVQFVALFELLAWPMRFIGWILSELPRAVVGNARLEGMFAEPITVLPAARPVRLPDGPLDARVAAVTYSYAGTGCSTGSACGSGPTNRWRSWVRRASARARWRSCSCGWTTPTRARC